MFHTIILYLETDCTALRGYPNSHDAAILHYFREKKKNNNETMDIKMALFPQLREIFNNLNMNFERDSSTIMRAKIIKLHLGCCFKTWSQFMSRLFPLGPGKSNYQRKMLYVMVSQGSRHYSNRNRPQRLLLNSIISQFENWDATAQERSH